MILENHVIVGELLESKAAQQVNLKGFEPRKKLKKLLTSIITPSILARFIVRYLCLLWIALSKLSTLENIAIL